MRVRAMVGTGAMAVALATGSVGTASAEGAEAVASEGSPEVLTCEVVFDALEDMSPEWTEEGIDQVEDWCEAITGEED
ncbi:hypothetical protein ACFT1A_25320 [Rhodococcus sp. NPDC057135]|uniref:hypothetical protein n=1 Tax=Rhodococcus sp. NPDC057135 TaxID=3346028 RepID=UPI00363D54A4